jgi:hypothetical protein
LFVVGKEFVVAREARERERGTRRERGEGEGFLFFFSKVREGGVRGLVV